MEQNAEAPGDAATQNTANMVPLARVHAVLDHASRQDEGVDEQEVGENLRQSKQVQKSVQVAAALWGSDQLEWPETELDRRAVYLEREAAAAAVGALASRDDADKARN